MDHRSHACNTAATRSSKVAAAMRDVVARKAPFRASANRGRRVWRRPRYCWAPRIDWDEFRRMSDARNSRAARLARDVVASRSEQIDSSRTSTTSEAHPTRSYAKIIASAIFARLIVSCDTVVRHRSRSSGRSADLADRSRPLLLLLLFTEETTTTSDDDAATPGRRRTSSPADPPPLLLLLFRGLLPLNSGAAAPLRTTRRCSSSSSSDSSSPPFKNRLCLFRQASSSSSSCTFVVVVVVGGTQKTPLTCIRKGPPSLFLWSWRVIKFA
mmetsp:Transcript_35881/g.114965  ORF Transcript_35881/g.114965 Transcript_35881/m.114965 type:complete len:270 (-) Transcript_35881:1030-1839(-)